MNARREIRILVMAGASGRDCVIFVERIELSLDLTESQRLVQV